MHTISPADLFRAGGLRLPDNAYAETASIAVNGEGVEGSVTQVDVTLPGRERAERVVFFTDLSINHRRVHGHAGWRSDGTPAIFLHQDEWQNATSNQHDKVVDLLTTFRAA